LRLALEQEEEVLLLPHRCNQHADVDELD